MAILWLLAIAIQAARRAAVAARAAVAVAAAPGCCYADTPSGIAVANFPVGLQLAGCNTDCGRVEVRAAAGAGERGWQFLCSSNWTLREAGVVCRSLGFESAFAAYPRFGGVPITATASAAPGGGGDEDEGGAHADAAAAAPWAVDVMCPTGNERGLHECEYRVVQPPPSAASSASASASAGPSPCDPSEAVGVACRAAGATRADAEFAPRARQAVAEWAVARAERARRVRRFGSNAADAPAGAVPGHGGEEDEADGEEGGEDSADSALAMAATVTACDVHPDVPRPWSAENARAAFVFADLVEADYAAMDSQLLVRLCDPTPVTTASTTSDALGTADAVAATATTTITTTRGQLLQDTLVDLVRRGLTWNALGMDLTQVRPRATPVGDPNNGTVGARRQRRQQLRRELDMVMELYLSHNPHAALHDFLDQPLREGARGGGGGGDNHHPHGDGAQDQHDNGGGSGGRGSDSGGGGGGGGGGNDDGEEERMFETLQRDGFLRIDDFGLGGDALDDLAATAAALLEQSPPTNAGGHDGDGGNGGVSLGEGGAAAAARLGARVSSTSGNLVATARLPLPALEALFFPTAAAASSSATTTTTTTATTTTVNGTTVNGTGGTALRPPRDGGRLGRVITRYLGPALLDGYKLTRLATARPADERSYVASRWHHDRSGRRLKAFVYLHDCDCAQGHPTQVALGTHRLLYYRTDSLHATRFRDAYVRGGGGGGGAGGGGAARGLGMGAGAGGFEVAQGCGPRGGGFIFDTHSVHKGTPEGRLPRTTAILEFHGALKCAAVRALGLPLPCPSGDQYMVQRRLLPPSSAGVGGRPDRSDGGDTGSDGSDRTGRSSAREREL